MMHAGFQRAMRIEHRAVRRGWIVHFSNLIDATQLEAFRARYSQLGVTPPSYTALVVKAIACALRNLLPTYPELNCAMTGLPFWKRVHYFDRVSAGVAISRDEEGLDGVVLGVIQDPDSMSLSQMTAQLRSYSTLPVKDVPYLRNCHYLFRLPGLLQALVMWFGRASPKLRQRYRGTFSLTSVGKFGVDIQLPQMAGLLFGFGALRDRPMVRHGQVVAAPTFYLSMSFDRLLMNGKPCALVMERIRDILEAAQFDDRPEDELKNQQAPPAEPVSENRPVKAAGRGGAPAAADAWTRSVENVG
jgi:hypothetical protein